MTPTTHVRVLTREGIWRVGDFRQVDGPSGELCRAISAWLSEKENGSPAPDTLTSREGCRMEGGTDEA